MTRRMKLFITIITLTLAACGGGGGSGDGGSAPAPAVPSTKTTAVLKIGTQGTLGAGVSLYGVGVIVTLPAGVTVATDSSGNVASSVAVVSGVASGGSIAPPGYTPATATAKATLKLVVAAAGSGFGTGEFVTVTCILPAGNSLQESDFPVSILGNLEPANQSLAPVSGLTPTITATLN
jgi:hypothetical protein